MTGWGEFAIAFLAFYGSHMIPSNPAIRARLVAVLGERFYAIAFEILSIMLFLWLIGSAARAPLVELWERAAWQNHLPQLLMLPACLLAAFGAGAPGGLSLGASATPFDPEKPGVARITRHPLLWAILIWSLAHLGPNGDLAHLLMFGSFALTAFVGMLAFDRRSRRRLGGEPWRQVQGVTAFVPLSKGVSIQGVERPWLRAAIALGAYFAILLLHEPVIGLSPI